jgi:O-acetyl-ADP-ribose deacetylase (regulator of RNase III)
MRLPIIRQNAEDAKECPFYCQDEAGNSGCLVKSMSASHDWKTAISHAGDEFEQAFKEDCHGLFENCVFANTIWQDYDYEEEPYEEDYEEEPEEEDESSEGENELKISVHYQENPYRVKADALIYPTSNMLTIEDPQLRRMSIGMQKQCMNILKNKDSIKLGHAYATTNGGKLSKVVPGYVLHAVVAGESGLIKDGALKDAMVRSLIMADTHGANIVTVIPAISVTYNDKAFGKERAAAVQLGSINDYATKHDIDNIEYIHIVTHDKEDYEIYTDVFSRIFS